MNPLLLNSILSLLQFATVHAPEVVASVKKMFDKGIPTAAEIQAERDRVNALTLDDTPEPS